MYTRKLTASKLFAVVLAAAMLLTMTVSAFASEIQPYYDSEISVTAKVDAYTQSYSVTIQAPSDTTKITMDATLYQKQLLGRKEISSFSQTSNSSICTKNKTASIESGKTYQIEVSAKVYSGGTYETIEETFTLKP